MIRSIVLSGLRVHVNRSCEIYYSFDSHQKNNKALFGLFFFITQFPSLNFRHLSLITLNNTPVWHHHSNFHHSIFFTLFVGPISVTHCRLFFFLPKLTEPSEKKKPEQTEVKEIRRRRRRKEKEKKNRTPKKKGKKKSTVVKSCGWYCCGSLFVCLITILPLSYELWKLKTAKMCFQFP